MRIEVAEELRIKKAILQNELLEKETLLTESAHHTERQRLLQDLHDGMGLQLYGLIGLVEHGSLDRGELTSEVRTTLEQLRVMMDGTASFDGTLAELFGHVRYRVETRLFRNAVELIWDCQLFNTTEAKVNPSSALNLQRMMFELCTNIIKHAKTSHVEVHIQVLGESNIAQELRIVVLDDGVGIQVESQAQNAASSANAQVLSSGAGTQSVKRRVAELNAHYEQLPSVPKGVQHVLHIPIASFY